MNGSRVPTLPLHHNLTLRLNNGYYSFILILLNLVLMSKIISNEKIINYKIIDLVETYAYKFFDVNLFITLNMKQLYFFTNKFGSAFHFWFNGWTAGENRFHFQLRSLLLPWLVVIFFFTTDYTKSAVKLWKFLPPLRAKPGAGKWVF